MWHFHNALPSVDVDTQFVATTLCDITSCIQHSRRTIALLYELYGQVMNCFCPRRKYDSENNLIDIIRGSNCSPQLNVLSLDFSLIPLHAMSFIILSGIKWKSMNGRVEERNHVFLV